MVERLARHTSTGRCTRRPDATPLAELLASASAGDGSATEALVERYSALVWSITWNYRLNGADAADVTQMVWLRLVENVGRIRQPSSLGAWLAAVTRHECLRVLGRGEREIVTAGDELNQPPALGDEIDVDILRRERDAAIRQAFGCLPARWRALLEAFIAAPSATYEEVAAVIGMPVGSIGPTKQRCYERLREAPGLVELNAA